MSVSRSWLHAFQTLPGESHQKQSARGNLINAPRLQVEQGVFFDLANGRAVRTLHVVGVDLQLRLGINLRVIGKKKVAVRLLGIGLLRIFVHNDASVKNTMRLAVQDSVVELTAAAMRTGVLDVHVVVQMLPAVADEQAIDQA